MQPPQTEQPEYDPRVDALLETLAKEARKRRKIRRFLIAVFIAFVVCRFIHAITSPGLFSWFEWVSQTLMGTLAIIGLFAMSEVQKRATKKLAMLDDVRAVGPLMEALGYIDSEVRKVAIEALLRLLPRMQASDAHFLNDVQRNCMYRALNAKEENFVLAVLKALEQVGDSRALPLVEKLAQGDAETYQEKRIRDAAQACLPFLRQRIEQESASRQLLRAASASGVPADTLLRPAQSVSETGPEQLLRASALEQ